MNIVTVQEAKAQLTALLELVETGETVIISQNNRNIAEIKPIKSRGGFGQGKSKVKYNTSWKDMDLEIEGLFNEE